MEERRVKRLFWLLFTFCAGTEVVVILKSAESGFSLISTLVSMAVVSIVGLAVMKLMGSQMKASAAVQLDMDRESVKRSLLQRVDCDASAPDQIPESGVRYIEVRGKNSSVLLPASSNGTKLGRFHYRASVNRDGALIIESRLLSSSGNVANHPVLGQAKQVDAVTKSKTSKLLLDWSPLFSLESPLCSFDKNGRKGNGSEDNSAELVYLPSGEFKAERGDVLVEVEYLSDGGFSCKNTLQFDGSNCSLKKVTEVGDKVQFVIKKDQSCRASVVSIGASGNCKGGVIKGANGLTAKQGTNLWRVQWEDRLAERGDAAKCKQERARKLPVELQFACSRLEAVDWNDGIWQINGIPIKSATR